MTAPTDDFHYVFSPSSTYPRPFAYLVDRQARIVHAWSSTVDQADPSTEPASYLKGWNHVEVGPDGSLYALVPLHSVLRLDADSQVMWRADVSAHHDLHVDAVGTVRTLGEEPRQVIWRGRPLTILDNTVVVLDSEGRQRAVHSLYEILSADARLGPLVGAALDARFLRSDPDDCERALAALGPAAPRRSRLAALRDLPGAPSDLLHANTVEVLAPHPSGLWPEGSVLVSLRNLNLVAVLDLALKKVLWWWGPGVLSGQHQPSMLSNGNVLIFDNGKDIGRSRAVECDPLSGAVVWEYLATPAESLFSQVAGGCEQPTDGHVLISDAQAGRALEVTRDGATVWGFEVERLDGRGARSRAAFYRVASVPGRVARQVTSSRGPAYEKVARAEPGLSLKLI
ncbi:arylsulfotransferase family protein [Streptomyces microflavus]|uniref:arylsulfotransferase family protein n=1 Tax=Streptomyces microflavus TaxID=1919 RepID=UPI003810E7C6